MGVLSPSVRPKLHLADRDQSVSRLDDWLVVSTTTSTDIIPLTAVQELGRMGTQSYPAYALHQELTFFRSPLSLGCSRALPIFYSPRYRSSIQPLKSWTKDGSHGY